MVPRCCRAQPPWHAGSGGRPDHAVSPAWIMTMKVMQSPATASMLCPGPCSPAEMPWLDLRSSWGSPRNHHMKRNYPASPLALPRVCAALARLSLLPGRSVCTSDAPSAGKSRPRRCWRVPPPQPTSPRKGDLLPASLGILLSRCPPRNASGDAAGCFFPGLQTHFLITIETSKHHSVCWHVRLSLLCACFLGTLWGMGACSHLSSRW